MKEKERERERALRDGNGVCGVDLVTWVTNWFIWVLFSGMPIVGHKVISG